MGVLKDIGERVAKMHHEAMSAQRPDLEPALIIYSPRGLRDLPLDHDIRYFESASLEGRFEDRPLYGCRQEVDTRAKALWRVLSRGAADLRERELQERETERRFGYR
jgi:hypothetical protein